MYQNSYPHISSTFGISLLTCIQATYRLYISVSNHLSVGTDITKTNIIIHMKKLISNIIPLIDISVALLAFYAFSVIGSLFFQ